MGHRVERQGRDGSKKILEMNIALKDAGKNVRMTIECNDGYYFQLANINGHAKRSGMKRHPRERYPLLVTL